VKAKVLGRASDLETHLLTNDGQDISVNVCQSCDWSFGFLFTDQLESKATSWVIRRSNDFHNIEDVSLLREQE